MKRFVLLILFCMGTDMLFAFQPRQEFFDICNFSDEEIFFYTEMNAIPISIDFEWYTCDINDLRLEIRSFGIIRLTPKQKAHYVSFYPIGADANKYEDLEKIAFVDKLKAIFKTFIITDSEGNILWTLESIKERDIIRQQPPENKDTYVLYILRKCSGD